MVDVTSVNKNERIATIERIHGWFLKKRETFQIRGFVEDEWFYYPEGDAIDIHLHDHLDDLVEDHVSKQSHEHSVDFQKKKRLERWSLDKR